MSLKATFFTSTMALASASGSSGSTTKPQPCSPATMAGSERGSTAAM